MNGTSRLYRSTSQRMLGGVASGLASYFGIDPNIIRIIFLVLAFITSGGFAFVYMLLWLLIPGTASTATDVNQVVNENLGDMGARLRGLTGAQAGNGGNGGNGGVAQPNGGTVASQGQLPPAGAPAQTRHVNPAVALIAIGVFFLLLNLGFFRYFAWGVWWPLLLVGLGLMMVRRHA
ncbi:MAG: PspC domain-containing protein [Chloroflexota bacterium]|nr:PspC domain-containing protein [Chloroflexota bacterium]